MARRRSIEERDADRAVLAALKARGGTATRADLVVATALPEMVVERSVSRLMDLYVSSVGVASGGVLLYRFAPGFRRRRERRVVLRALLASVAGVARTTARAARLVFRAMLALQLIVYMFIVLLPASVVAGVVAGIAILVMGLFSDAGGDILQLLVDPYGAAFVLGVCVLIGIGWAFKKKYELLLRLVGARELDVGGGGVDGLVARVNAFAIGPPAEDSGRDERIDRTWTISQADERRVLARVRDRGGRLRAGDLVSWLGLSLEEAEAQVTRLAVEYGGEPAPLDANGLEVVEFRFPSLMTTAADGASSSERPDGMTRFERGERVPVFTGNEPRHDLAVAGFALVNLAAGLIAGHWLGPMREDAPWGWPAWIGGTALPVGFSLLLYAMPLLRSPAFLWRRARALRVLDRARAIKAMVVHARTRREAPLDLARLAEEVPPAPPLETPSRDQLRKIALELGGSTDLDSADDPTKTVWRFRRLAAELASPVEAAPAQLRRVGASELVE